MDLKESTNLETFSQKYNYVHSILNYALSNAQNILTMKTASKAKYARDYVVPSVTHNQLGVNELSLSSMLKVSWEIIPHDSDVSTLIDLNLIKDLHL
jgi:hypothetical protein